LTGAANSADASGNIKCWVENSGGNAKNVTYVNNTAISPSQFNMANTQFYLQQINNTVANNIWADTDSGHVSDITCSGGSLTEGNNSLACWDASTFIEGGNVLQGRLSTNWTATYNGGTANATPANASCSTATPDATCVGWRKFINGAVFQTTFCDNSLAPFNCPQMSPPWATNVLLTDLQLCAAGLGSCAGPSSFLGKGADIAAMQTAFTQTQYVCPKDCGSTGPYPDTQ